MLPITEVYTRYQVPPQLIRHMLLATAIADWLLTRWSSKQINNSVVIETLLIHDLANILKFDWDAPPEMFGWKQEEAQKYRDVARRMRKKYGADEVIATSSIISELGVRAEVLATFHRLGERHHNPWQPDEWEVKLVWYADMRTGPQGLVTVEERFADGFRRYGNRPGFNQSRFETDLQRCRAIERELEQRINQPLSQLTPLSISSHYQKVSGSHLDTSVTLHRLPQL